MKKLTKDHANIRFVWSIKNSNEVLNKLNSTGFHASSLSTYDFSTLYTTLPHNLIKQKLRVRFKGEALLFLFVMIVMHSLLLTNNNCSNFGLVKTFQTHCHIFQTTFSLDLALSYIDKLCEFRRILILDCDVPSAPSYGIYFPQLIQFARVFSYLADFNVRNFDCQSSPTGLSVS